MRPGALLVLVALVAGCGDPTFDVDAPFAIVHSAPTEGGVDIATDVDVRIGFNRAVDRETAATDIALTHPGDEPEEVVAVERTLLFELDDTVVVIVPRRELPAGTEMRIGVSGDMKSADNVKLATPFEAFFTTIGE